MTIGPSISKVPDHIMIDKNEDQNIICIFIPYSKFFELP
jgi:hypothetical protein